MGAQTSWLKVDEGSSLAVGHFDIGGEKADSGLKGFIYGERGVWRPGDAIHLSFILYDRTGKLPAKYPIAFELEDPLGRIVRTGGYSDSVNGFYAIDAATVQDAPTGTYVARVTAGGRTFTKNLKIETVMPNRLKIDLDWGGPQGAAPYISTDTDSMTLSASWLTGAKAGALKADVSATFAAAGTTFTTLPDYTFDDPTRTASSGRVVLFDDRLGNDGSANFSVDLGSDKSLPPGKLTANILTRVFEPSGVFSSETTSVDFHPYERYVGLRLPKGDAARGMLLVDKDQRVDLAMVDRDGKLLKGGGTVDIALYQLDWRWWWEKGDESLAQRADELYAAPDQEGHGDYRPRRPRILDLPGEVPELGTLPRQGRGQAGRACRGQDRLHRLAGLGGEGPRLRRGRGHARALGRGAEVRARRQGLRQLPLERRAEAPSCRSSAPAGYSARSGCRRKRKRRPTSSR